jgi:cyclopropane-fatty-acyl-phospholipid synthase
MSFLSASSSLSSLLALDRGDPYNTVRPHHLVVLYTAYSFLKSTRLSKSVSASILSTISKTTDVFLPLVYTGLVPDYFIRLAIRLRCRDHLQILKEEGAEADHATKMGIIQELKSLPIAIKTDEANEQHYEVPAAFYDMSLGPRKKYSSGLWPDKSTTFEESEVAMLELYCQRAGIEDGMHIVDLGCGWGSLTLFLAEKYRNAKITSISNSNSQREYIYSTAKKWGLNVDNINIVTCNVADDKGALDVVKGNDRVMSIEMFEHMKNYSTLLSKIHGFLKPGGKMFIHIFTHKDFAYHFADGWMADNFFTGGTMPSDDLLLYFGEHFSCLDHWRVNGSNYEKTSNAWLYTMDKHWKSGELKPVLEEAYGVGKGKEWYVNWRLFFLACAELWGYDKGEEWIVSHYLFERRG